MTRKRKLIGGGILASLALMAVAAAGVWYVALRDDAPARASLSDAVASVGDAQTPSPAPAGAASGPTTGAAPSPAAGQSVVPPPAPVDDLAGTWTIMRNSESFVGYRVREELARIGATTAVGRTSNVAATLVFDGAAITDVRVEADLRTLRSDQSLRDNALRTQALETARFPTATFVLTQPIRLDSVPPEGTPVKATAVGDLTLHGVTRQVSIALEGQRANGLVVVVGSVEIRFGDFNIAQPRAATVLSVEDRALVELQLVFQRTPRG